MCIRNTVRDEIDSYPYIDFFPSIRPIIEERLYTRNQMDDFYKSAGFVPAAQTCNWHEVAPTWPAFADKLRLRADSFIARLEDADFRTGLENIDAHAAKHSEDGPLGVNIDTLLYRLT